MRGISIAPRRVGAPFALALPALDGAGLALALVCVGLVSVGLLHFTDPDYWWHLRTGRLIVETGAVPQADPFSFTAAGSDWLAHEWLAEVVIYGLQAAGGYALLTVVFVSMALACLLLAHRMARGLGLAPWPAAGLLFWAGLMTVLFWTVRPVVFSWLLFAVFLYLLLEHRRGPASPAGRRNRLWLLPPLMLLWANLHAGYVIGLALIALYIVASLAERRLWAEARDLRSPALVLVACVLVTVVNPNTYELLLYPLTYVQPGNASLDFINEWQSPDFHSFVFKPLALSIAALAALGAWNRRRDLFLPLLALGFTYLALDSVRHVPLFGLVFLVVMGGLLPERFAWARADGRRPGAPARPLVNWALVLAVVALVGYGLAQAAALQLGAEARRAGAFDYPKAGVEFIRAEYPDARIFNSYRWGGYLINELFPDQKVFIDGRADMYGDAFMTRYVEVLRMKPGWQATLAEYDVDLVIVEVDAPLTERLDAMPEAWRRVFTGPVEVVFVRRDLAQP